VLSALALGLPLVIRPVAADHPFNAARAEQLGVARIITDPGDAGVTAQTVLNDPAFRQSAQKVQALNATLPSPAHVLHSLEALRTAR
jgi:UDP:flavonoid glycosyltransferase YjiC (YdhE family)